MIVNIYSYVFNIISIGLSFLGCIFIIVHYSWIPLLRKSLSRFIIYPTICLLASLIVTFPSFFHGSAITINHSSSLCFLQQSVIQFSIFVNFLWSIIISVNLLYLCFSPNKNLKKFEIIYHIICWGLSILVTIITRIPLIGYEIFSECGPGGVPSTFKFYTDTVLISGFILFNIIVLLITIKHMINGNLVDSEKKTTLLFNNEKRITAKKIVWRLLLYPIILSICYIPTLVFTVYQYEKYKDDTENEMISTKELNLLAGFARAVFHLQGFFNALVYLKSSKLRYQYKRFRIFRKIFWRNDESNHNNNKNNKNNDSDINGEDDINNSNNGGSNNSNSITTANRPGSVSNYVLIKSSSNNNFRNSYTLSSSLTTPFLSDKNYK